MYSSPVETYMLYNQVVGGSILDQACVCCGILFTNVHNDFNGHAASF